MQQLEGGEPTGHRILRATILSLLLVVGGWAFFGNYEIEEAQAAQASHDAGNVTFTVSDNGRFVDSIQYRGVDQEGFPGIVQSHYVHYQNNYTAKKGNDPNEVADASIRFRSPGNGGGNDFEVTATDTAMSLVTDNSGSGTVDMSLGSYTNTGAVDDETDDVNDTRVYQRTWTREGENWALIKYQVENIYPDTLTDFRMGFYFVSRVSNAPANDLDGWDGINNTYYIWDTVIGDYVGLTSADPSLPIDVHFAAPYGTNGFGQSDEEYIDALGVKNGQYEQTWGTEILPGGNPLTVLVGWNNADAGFTIPGKSFLERPLIIAFGE